MRFKLLRSDKRSVLYATYQAILVTVLFIEHSDIMTNVDCYHAKNIIMS